MAVKQAGGKIITTMWRSGNGGLRRVASLYARRIAALWRSIAGPGRRVRLPKRSPV
jgi:hypothetical protein